MKMSLPLIILASLALAGCQSNPGGLTDQEYNSLSADRKAELRMEQESLNEERAMRIDEEVDRINRDSQQSHGWNHEARRDLDDAMKGKDLSGLK